jgi:predicted DNA-binding transcriptional regulator AlpA
MNEPTFRYMPRDEICSIRGVGRTKQIEDEKAGRFPAGERLSVRMIRWRSDIVARWIEAESARAQAASNDLAVKAKEKTGPAIEGRQKKRDAGRTGILHAQAA